MEEKKYTDLWTCPHCKSKKYRELADYEPIMNETNGILYQYYASQCKECGKKFYNVARYIGALSAEEFNELTNTNRFKDYEED